MAKYTKARFNSIVVRLKGNFCVRYSHYDKGFNSIVVRLKAVRRLFLCAGLLRFQFHSGSIKSNLCTTAHPTLRRVSIP